MQGRRWIIPLVILALLLTASVFRWQEMASKSIDDGVIKWERDRWTKDTWMNVYTIQQSGSKLAVPAQFYTEAKDEAARKKRDALSTSRDIAVGVMIIWLAIEIIRAKRKPKEQETIKTE